MTIENSHNYETILLESAFGSDLVAYLNDPETIELMLNPDGSILLETTKKRKHFVGVSLRPEQATNIIKLVASMHNLTVNHNYPEVSGNLPGWRARFQGWLPPVCEQPTFSIRKQAHSELTFQDYVDSKLMSAKDAAFLREAFFNRRNIIISGGTSTGKTTFASALLGELRDTSERVFILEDMPELQAPLADLVRLRTTPNVTMRDLVRGCLRMRPDRIVVGEVRDGAALDLLKAWNTGHPGGLATVHANAATSVPARLCDLVGEAVQVVPNSLIEQTVDIVVHLDRQPGKRGVVGEVVEFR